MAGVQQPHLGWICIATPVGWFPARVVVIQVSSPPAVSRLLLRLWSIIAITYDSTCSHQLHQWCNAITVCGSCFPIGVESKNTPVLNIKPVCYFGTLNPVIRITRVPASNRSALCIHLCTGTVALPHGHCDSTMLAYVRCKYS